MRKRVMKKLIILLLLVIEVWQIVGSVLVAEAAIKKGDVVHLQGDHECDSLLEYWMEDYQKWSYKIVWYVYYMDKEEEKRYPAFCIEPAKAGVGTGYDSYDTTIQSEKDNRIWRILDKGYMGSSYQDWKLECDDDFYSATKVALHCLVDGVAPREKYVLGDRSVDGNSVEEIRRRGAKVLEVAQTLYEYGVNGSEVYVAPKVSIQKQENGKEEKIQNSSYYVQNYQVSGNKALKSYEVEIQNFPIGTKVLNSKNEEQNVLSSSSFKVAIPIEQIKQDIKGKIQIKNAEIKTNPIFYCKSGSSEAQSYVTYTSGYEKANTTTTLEIKANTCKLEIQKMDKESKNAIPNVTFEIRDEKGNYLDTITTNEKGVAELKDLYPQTVMVKEVKAPEPYILAKETMVKLEWGKTVNVIVENERKKGELKIIKVDADNYEIPLENVEFELWNEQGKKVKNLLTNKKGEAVINNLDIGTYTLKEVRTKQGYDLAEDRTIEIKWKEEAVEIIENKKQKGQIEVYKIDAENQKQKLEGVIFEVLDENQKRVETIITNKEGYAVTSKLPIGTYYLKEIRTQNKYRLKQELIEVEIKKEQTTTLEITNQKKKGRIEIYKVDAEEKEIKLEKVEFQVFDNSHNIVENLVTNKDGYAITKELPIGEYYIKEVKTKEIYQLKEEEIKVEVKDKVVETLEIENEKIEGQIRINKISAEDNLRNGDLKGTPIEGVVFEIKNEKGEILETIITNKDGIAMSKELEKGTYYIKEIETNQDYEITEEEFAIEIVEHNKIEEITIKNSPKAPETPKLPRTGF